MQTLVKISFDLNLISFFVIFCHLHFDHCDLANENWTEKEICQKVISTSRGDGSWSSQNSGVNIINVLRAAFTYVGFACSFFVLTFRCVLYWRKNTSVKAARRMLMKLCPGVNIINILQAAFAPVDFSWSCWCTL